MDTIDRQAAIDLFMNDGYVVLHLVRRMIKELSSVQEERKIGKWIDNETSYADGVRQTCTCSICGQRSVRPLGRFCRWCGADMRGAEK